MRTREEHLAWCKERALEYCDAGDARNAYQSMASDLGQHDETREHSGIELGLMLMLIGDLSTPAEMRRFIEGFN